jgi:glucose-6-phosphate-specific signal transduction histidine kinase
MTDQPGTLAFFSDRPFRMRWLRKIHEYLGLFIAPTLLMFTFTGALQLFGLHEAVIDCRLFGFESFPLTKVEETKFGLGLYRIVEQALLNSILHGKASAFSVTVSKTEPGWKMEISNNGAGFNPQTALQGHGFAVIDSWVSKLHGNWSISSKQNQVLLEVAIN